MKDGQALWLQFLFLISGVSQTILCNLISYHGGASPSTLLPVFTSYLASAMVYFIPTDKSNNENTPSDDSSTNTKLNTPHHSPVRKLNIKRQISFKNHIMSKNEIRIMFIALYDLVCGIISFLSLVWSGSAVFQLVYSSIIIVTATFRHFLLPNTKLTLQQWIACCIVTFGLLLSGFGQNGNHQHSGATSIIANMWLAFSQLLWPLITTFLYAFEYVLLEKLLHDKNAPSENELCCKMGCYGLIFVCLYILFNVIPDWNIVLLHEITVHNGSGHTIIISYIFLFISYFIHNWSYFKLLHCSGAVSTGINQALRAVGVFVLSGICFCELQEAQCFNSFKFLSLIIVIIGVLRYAFITAMYQHNKKGQLVIVQMDQNKQLHVV